MAQTIAEQILSHAVGRPVSPGELVTLRPDVIMAHDSLAPSIISILRKRLGLQNVADPDQCVLVMDHVAPASTVGTADNQNLVRAFAREEGIRLFEVGRGICHQLMVENGHVKPGDIFVGADSHTPTYGALNAFAIGVGSTDLAAVLLSGKIWLKVPETIRIELVGEFPKGVTAKDLILFLVGQLSISGATYKAVEYTGRLSPAQAERSGTALVDLVVAVVVEPIAYLGVVAYGEAGAPFPVDAGHEADFARG